MEGPEGTLAVGLSAHGVGAEGRELTRRGKLIASGVACGSRLACVCQGS